MDTCFYTTTDCMSHTVHEWAFLSPWLAENIFFFREQVLIYYKHECFGIELFNCTRWMHCRWMPCPLFIFLTVCHSLSSSLMNVGHDAVTAERSPLVVSHTGPKFHQSPEVTPKHPSNPSLKRSKAVVLKLLLACLPSDGERSSHNPHPTILINH